MKKIILFFGAVVALYSCRFNIPSEVVEGIASALLEETPVQAEGLMELPAGAPGDNIITHTGYTISYNTTTLIPNWVAYELTAEEASGDEDRGERTFSMDPDFKKYQARREDYSGSGWTKGHMAPAGDFRWDEEAMDETFYLTNVCPQNERLNAKDWNYLEKKVRGWARDFGKVWVVTGPIVGDNLYGKIGERSVTVPDSFFKAVLSVSKGKYRAIAFVMGNDSDRYYLKDCAMSVNDLEELTGLDFFPMLDDSIEESTEEGFSLSYWHINN